MSLKKAFINKVNLKEIFFLPNYNDFIAKKILELINPMDKTIIFCANQAHANEVKRAIDKYKSVKKEMIIV